MGQARREMGQARRWAPPVGVFLLAVSIRLLPWPGVFTAEGMIPPGGADEFYHLRRIEYSVEHFPAVLTFDPYVSHPHGAEIVWPPAWDLAIAAAVRVGVGPGDRSGMETVAAWAPVVVAGITVALVFLVAARHFGRRAAWVAAIGLALLPAHFVQSKIGKVDHHVAVALISLVLCGLAMRWLSDGPRARGAPARAATLGLVMTLSLLVWVGSLIHIAVVLAVALALALADRERDRAVRWFGQLSLACGVALVSVVPFSWGVRWENWGAFSPSVLSSFHPALFGAAALCLGGVAALWRLTELGRDRRTRILSAFGVAGVGLGLALAALPGLAEAIDTSLGWFENREDFHLRVRELRPMWWPTGRFQPEVAAGLLTPFVAFLPLALVWMGWRAARGLEPRSAWLLVAWAAAFFVVASIQVRFSNSLSVPAAFAAGWFADRLLQAPCAQTSCARRVLPVLLLLAVAPSVVRFYAQPLGELLGALRGGSAERVEADVRGASMRPVARWLGENTPETLGYLDPTQIPEYGVLSSWSVGHLVRYYGRRPMVQDNFGVYGGRASYEDADAYYSATLEDEALSILERLGVRYVIARSVGSGHGRDYAADTMTRRLGVDRGSARRVRARDGSGFRELPALTRHRLVFEAEILRPATAADWDARSRDASAIKVYEIVPGARIEGRADRGARVLARLRLQTPLRSLTWETGAVADEAGRYVLRVPHPSGIEEGAVTTAPAWTIASTRGARAQLEISEHQVQRGAEVPGPDLRE